MVKASFYCRDCLEWLKEQADDSVDLILCSPPYEDARKYDELEFDLKGEDYVRWALERYVECVRVSRGLVAWVIEGRTKDFRWTASPALLMADLHRRGIRLRKPPIYKRVGIPGSGGPDWWRSDTEFIVCASKGRLPWSDPCITGHKPKYGPGGRPSHRKPNGCRVNAAAFSNQSFRKLLTDYVYATKTGTDEILQNLQEAINSKTVSEWVLGIVKGLQQAVVLQSDVSWGIQGCGVEGISGERKRPDYSEEDHAENTMREVRIDKAFTRSSSGRESAKQRGEQSNGALQQLSSERASSSASAMQSLWQSKSSKATLRQALQEINAEWKSLDTQSQSVLTSHYGRSSYKPPERANPGNFIYESDDVIECHGGGGHLGSKLSHTNEAPFPEKLAEAFVLSFCPPEGVVLDCFCGSGTTLAVALRNGRNAIGVDIRPGQISLTKRRLLE